jgi:hypothetical protein
MGGMIFKSNWDLIKRTFDENNSKEMLTLEHVLTGNLRLPTKRGFTLKEIRGYLHVINLKEIGKWLITDVEYYMHSSILM